MRLSIGLVVFAIGCQEPATGQDPNPNEKSSPGFALVELFTSEGCSSCPPADRLLAELQTRADRDEVEIIGLSFHVDYWDYLGWRDRFADPAFTARQREYARAWGIRSVYTPQTVVNGSVEFVGSDAKRTEQAIAAALRTNPEGKTELRPTHAKNGEKLEIEFIVTGVDEGSVLNVALVQRSAESQVTRGENGGRQLSHVNVVRVFHTERVSDGSRGQFKLAIPDSLKPSELRVIGYVQDPKTKRVLNVAEVPLK